MVFIVKVFISSNTVESEIDKKVVNLLTSIGIHSNDIYTFPVPGQGTKSGDDILKIILENIKSAELVIFIITSSFFESIYCQNEVGASFALERNSILLLVPPIKLEDIKGKGFLDSSRTHMAYINKEEDINDAYEKILETLHMNKLSENRWSDVRKTFLKDIETLTKKIGIEDSLNQSEAVRTECDDYVDGVYRYKSNYIDFTGYIPEFPKNRNGSCSICFENDELHGVNITLGHEQIMKLLFSGLNTSPENGYRNFVSFREKEKYYLSIGNNNFILKHNEVEDLCKAIDNYSVHYLEKIKEIENYLEIKNFAAAKNYIGGYRLLKIKRSLWENMVKFSREFDYSKGTTDWHIFDSSGDWIKVYKNGIRHAVFCGERTDYEDIERPSDDMWVILNLDILYKSGIKLDNINQCEIWGAKTSADWLINNLIPKVIEHFKLANSENYYDLYNDISRKEERIIQSMQEFYNSKSVFISDKEVENLLEALSYCLYKRTIPKGNYSYIISKLGLSYINSTELQLQALAREIANEAKKKINIELDARSSVADDVLRSILSFFGVDGTVSDDDWKVISEYLEPLVKKMEKIRFIDRYTVL